MTGFDIKNAIARAYGFEAKPDPYDAEAIDVSEGLSRLQRLLFGLLMVMKGGT